MAGIFLGSLMQKRSWIHSQNNVVMTCTSRVTDIFLELIPIPWGIGRTIAVF